MKFKLHKNLETIPNLEDCEKIVTFFQGNKILFAVKSIISCRK